MATSRVSESKAGVPPKAPWAQACKDGHGTGEQEAFHHVILFDDRWAAAHPRLANGILRFASDWDIL